MKAQVGNLYAKNKEGTSLHLLSTYCTIDRQTSPTCLEQERGSGAGYGTLIENPEDGSTTNYIYSTTAAAAQQTTFFNTTSSSRSDSDEREVESAVLKGIFSPRPGTTSQPRNTKRSFACC